MEKVPEEDEEMEKRLKEMEDEAAALRELQAKLEKAMGAGQDPAVVTAGQANKEEIDSRSVFVGNVDYACTPEEVQQHFQSCGTVNRVTIRTNKYGKPKGYAYVEFLEPDAVQEALRLNESVLHGRQLKVLAKRTNVPGLKQFRPRRANPYMGYGFRGAYPPPYFYSPYDFGFCPPVKKRSSQIVNQIRRIWKKEQLTEKDKEGQAEMEAIKQSRRVLRELKGEVNEEFLSWLSRSLVCTSEEPRDLASLSSAIVSGYGQCTKICALSGFKFILTFQSRDEMEEALRNHEELDLWFKDIKRWERYDSCSTRKVWLEVVGVPPHGWKWENFKKIAGIWGYLICLGRSVAKTDTFESMRLLIETDVLGRIDDEFIFTLGDMGFRVIVREIAPASPICQQPFHSKHQQEDDAGSNDEVPGFEDIEKVCDSAADSGEAGRMIQESPIEDLQHHHGNEHLVIQSRSNSNSKFEKRCEQPEMEVAVMLSQNERSDVVIKEYKLLTSQDCEVDATKNMSNDESHQEPPGFEGRAMSHLSQDTSYCPLANEGIHQAAHNLGPGEVQGFLPRDNGSISGVHNAKSSRATMNCEPPGFERMANLSLAQKVPEGNKQPECVNKRLTRSQAKKLKEATGGGQLELDGRGPDNGVVKSTSRALLPISQQPFVEGELQIQQQEEALAQSPSFEPPSRASKEKMKRADQRLQKADQNLACGHSEAGSPTHTSDSFQKLAEEAIRIGELLGVKVILHRTLEKSRVPKSKKAGV